MRIIITDVVIDNLLDELDATVDSLESGVHCDGETREIVRKWVDDLFNNSHVTIVYYKEEK